MRHRRLFILLTSLAFLAGACSYARWQRLDPAEKAASLAEILAGQLDLSPAQQAQALPPLRRLVDEQAAWRGQGSEVLGELKTALEGATFGAKALTAQAEAREKRLAASRTAAIQALGELHAVLTPPQRAKAAELLGKLQARWQKRYGAAAKP